MKYYTCMLTQLLSQYYLITYAYTTKISNPGSFCVCNPLNNSQTHLALTFRPSFTSMIMCQHATPTPTPCSVSHHIQSIEHMDWTSFFTFVLNWSTIPKLKIPPKLRSILKLIKSLLTPLFPNFYDIIFISSTSTSRIRSSIACQYLIFRYKYSKLPYK